jgi:pimeloyl-ACP methyl ester carboxylesterase
MTRTRRLADLDGRRLAYLELGDPAGKPALYLHGTPSSGSEAGWLDAAAQRHGVRLIAPDRPGYLESDPPAERSLVGAAAMLLALTRQLDLGRFGIATFSGGAATGLGIAYLAPEAVTVLHVGGGLGSIAAAGPDELGRGKRALFGLITTVPLLAAVPMRMNRRILSRRFAESPAAAARELYKGPARGAQLAATEEYVSTADADDLREEMTSYIASTAASAAIVDDLRAYVRPWPFELRDIEVPVELWHGTDDPAVPPAFARRAASELTHGRLHLLDGEGHFVFHTHADEIAASLADHAA